ncbi:arginine repressor [Lucifera butyrica]|uniref:Arginine repressor n=1 Tax=Lucifera butyrica TaxID=1351585 RepID=A0A498R9E0_9FIRM|nr:arginine repressor [Lucifera butyrica]VBB08001.1 arginine repressor [Lucifera butyrica]
MKGLRHAKIKQIIEQQIIDTQEDLAEALKKEGIEVTQATVSRDIKELMLIKVPIGDGQYRYAFPPEQNAAFAQSRMRTFQDSVLSIDFSGNIIVLKTLPGTAQAVAFMIDYVKWPEVLGTVAGDDTIFVAVKPVEVAEQVVAKFHALL